MCIGCLVISTLTFIVPVSDVPVSNISQPINESVPTTLAIAQASSGIAAVENEIQSVLAQLPDSEDADLLQNSLETTLSRLNTATSDQHAQVIVDEEMNKLAEALAQAPNAEQVTTILLDIRERANRNGLQNETGLAELRSNAGFMSLQKGLQLNQSGWLS